ncbi:hypothetical protein D3C71_2008860 [compost metagenome]
MNVTERDVIRWREILCRERIQRTNINFAHRVTFAGTDGGQMPGSNDRQRRITAQRTGLGVLLVIIVRDGLQQMLLFFAARKPRLALNDVTRA